MKLLLDRETHVCVCADKFSAELRSFGEGWEVFREDWQVFS
jgi:hypothetical protein